jgi:hypothetical protein
MMEHHTNTQRDRKENSVELVNQILQHDPCASVEMITNVLSQWGILLDDHNRAACETEERLRLHPVDD